MGEKPLYVDGFAEAVLRDYADTVYRLALSRLRSKADAEDVFQDVFLRLVKSGKTFESAEHIKAWLIRVTVNCCNKLRGTAWFRHTVALEAADLEGVQTPVETCETSVVYDAVAGLAPKYRTVIHLFYYEDMSVSEIGKALGQRTSTVTSKLTRARKILREKLKGEYGYE
jgi:RNA polymerase sigma-70 factor (ECF subfamily)